MICRMCGSENEDCAKFCIFCGEAFFKEEKKEDIKDGVDLTKTLASTQQNNQTINQDSNSDHNYYNRISEIQDNQNIKTYMTHSIVSLIISFLFVLFLGYFVFIPIGLASAAIVFAYKTEQFLKSGMLELAAKNSKNAKNFFIGSLVSTVVLFIFTIVAGIFYVLSIIREIGGSFDKFKEFNNPDQMKEFFEKILKEVQQRSSNQI